MKPSHAAPRLIRLLRPPSSKRTRVVEPFGLLEGLGRTLGALRTAIGMGALVTPSLPAAPWVGVYEAKRASVRLFGRTLGGRDLAQLPPCYSTPRKRVESKLCCGLDTQPELHVWTWAKPIDRLGSTLNCALHSSLTYPSRIIIAHETL